MTLLINLLLGLVPTLVLAGSIAAGVDDDAHHRRVFLLVYGLWAITLALGNWLESSHPAWIVVWSVLGILALALSYYRKPS